MYGRGHGRVWACTHGRYRGAAFSGLIWIDGEPLHFIIGIISTISLFVAFAGGIEGRLFSPLLLWQRAVLLAMALGVLFMSDIYRLLALVVIVAVCLLNYRQPETSASEATRRSG